jgi:S-adenosylmethionine decarboxylase
MHFEGSEKKIELFAQGAEFRRRPAEFWSALVETAGAKILSKISNGSCDAYLLSESSLFVWDDRITLITCGRTTLVRAALFLLDKIGEKAMDFFSYERKNEYFPRQQQTDFYKDVKLLQKAMKGSAFRFGSFDEHHLLLYHMEKPFTPQGMDCTLEVLMYNLQGQAKEIFNYDQTIDRVRQLTKLDQIFPDFQIDDYLFRPCGYSLNAIRGSEYYTLHVTPEDPVSYVSFETNVHLCDRMSETLLKVVNVFQPRSFDVIHFHPKEGIRALEVEPFVRRNDIRQNLECGYEVAFSTFYLSGTESANALEINL